MERDNPMVSIVMPVFNAEKYLKESIQDIIFQTYSDWELICVDDGSTDQSSEILKYYASRDDRIRVITQENKGAGAARNRGMDEAKGTYLLFLDADDRFEPKLLHETTERAIDIRADIVLFGAECFDSKTMVKTSSDWIFNKEFVPNLGVFSYRDCPERIFNISASGTWNKAFRTEFIRDRGLRFMNTPYMNDSYFVQVGMVLANRICICEEKLIYYRLKIRDSLTAPENRIKNPYCPFSVLSQIKDKLVELKVYEEVWKSFANYALNHIFWNEEQLDYDEFIKYISEIKETYIAKYRIDKLEEEDYINTERIWKIKILMNEDVIRYLHSFMRELSTKCSKYFNELRIRPFGSFIPAEKFFRIPGVENNNRIIVYGAGHKGHELIKQIMKNEQYKLVAWVDKRYKELNETFYKIESPEIIKTCEYDFIVIAVDDFYVMQDIKSTIDNMDENKIVWA